MFSSLLVLLFIIKLKLKCATNEFNYFNKSYIFPRILLINVGQKTIAKNLSIQVHAC